MSSGFLGDAELVGAALNAGEDSDLYWDSVRELQRRGTQTVFDIASELCGLEDPSRRRLGLNILAQLGYERGRPFLEGSLPIALNLAVDSELRVRRSALSALGHLGDARALKVLLRMVADPDAGIRLEVAQAMPSVLGDPPLPEAVAALTTLMADADGQVRDWATFGLGSLLDVDSEPIRQALQTRLDDRSGDTAGEALVGLARRRDPQVLTRVRAVLDGDDVGNLTVEAAGELADRSLLPSLERLKASGWADRDPRGWLLEEALAACREGNSMGR
jgi:HEAT repeat protein